MAIWQGESVRMPTGGRRRLARNKKKFEIGREIVLAELGETKAVAIRTRGGNSKRRALKAKIVNVTDPATGKTVRAEIITVVENPANPHYSRRNIITKGAILNTKAGKARVTSRPGQDGVVNAVKVA